ncbi:MAG: response regulator transcription factor [Actinomycetota bacterium]|nr:response regulator transcription factor [Actinomycetota bacterium]
MTITVLIADDHAIVRRGLAELLATAEDLVVVGAAADGQQAVELARLHQPSVVLMDLSMPRLDGVAATRQLLAVSPRSRVVILTSFSEQERILAAIEAGAVGYLLKDTEPDQLLRGVRSAAAGEAPFSPRAATALLPAAGSRHPVLTPREREVLALVAEGLPNKSIARRLGISEKTVKTHVGSVFGALGVADRTSAALWAQRNGLGPGDAVGS